MVPNALRRREACLAMVMAPLLTSLALASMPAEGMSPAGQSAHEAAPFLQRISAIAMPTPLSGAEPAIMDVPLPAERRADALLELTVRPDRTSSSERYLVTVVELCGTPEEEKPLGSFSFFPPPSKGKTRTFLVPAPSCAAPGTTARIKLQMIPAEPGDTLKTSAVSILNARIAE
jgi:hypothetical protein